MNDRHVKLSRPAPLNLRRQIQVERATSSIAHANRLHRNHPIFITPMNTVLRASWLICLMLSTFLLQACQPRGTSTNQNTGAEESASSPSGMQSVMSDSVNYSHEYSFEYTLFDLNQPKSPAVGGGAVDRLASGGAKACCIQLPAVWHEGLKVKVRWEPYGKQGSEEPIERTLEIPRYEQLSDLYVVFHARNDVELVVSVGEPGHPNWQGRVKQTPWDQCVQAQGRKQCLAATPKTFDAKSERGFCTYTKSKDFPKENYDGDLLCKAAFIHCTQEYEDQEFCKKILWSDEK